MIAFIRTGDRVIPEECEANTNTKKANQIWIYNFLTKKESLLVANNFQCKEPMKQVIDPADLSFSPDNKTLYFITSAWVTLVLYMQLISKMQNSILLHQQMNLG